MDIVSHRPSYPRIVLQGCLLVGILDGLDAILFYGSRGASVSGIFQYIASALLGGDAFTMGPSATLLGILLHFTVAAVLTAVYLALAVRWTIFWRQFLLMGAIYGLVVHIAITYLIIPLTRVPFVGPFTWPSFLNTLFAHVFLVGIPIAWLVRRGLTGRTTLGSEGRIKL